MNDKGKNALAKHKDVVLRLYSEVWTEAIFSHLDELLEPRFTFHIRGHSIEQRPEDLVEIVSRWKRAFPDFRFGVEELVAEDDRVAARVFYTGTQVGAWKDLPPTGKKVIVHEMVFFRFENERIVEVWEVADEFSLRKQILGEND